MTTVFAVCATIGCTVLVIQFVMTLIGLGGHDAGGDMSGDVGHGLGGDVGHDFAGDVHGDVATDFHGDAGAGAAGDLHHGGAGAEAHAETAGTEHAGHAAAHGSTWLFGVLSFRTVVAALAFFGLAGLAADAANLWAPIALLVAIAVGLAAMYGVFWMMRGLSMLRSEGTVQIQRAVGQHATVYLRIPKAKAGTGKVHVNVQNRTMEYQALTAGEEIPTGSKVVIVDVVTSDTVEVEPLETDKPFYVP